MLDKFDELKRMIEEYDRIKGILINPSDQHILNDTKTQIQYLRESAINLRNQLPQSIYDSSLLSEISRLQRSFQERIEYEEIIKNSTISIDSNLSLMIKNAQRLSESIAVNQASLSSLFSENKNSFILPLTRISEAFASVTALSEYYHSSSSIYQYAFHHTLLYQRFVSAQLDRIKNEPKYLAARRAQIIEYSGELFEMSEDAFESGFALCDENEWKEENRESEAQGSCPNLYPTLNRQISYLYRQDRDYGFDDVEVAFFNSYSAKISMQGSKMISLIIIINESAERNSNIPIFKPSTRSMEACNKIPTLIARNECEFSKIVNLLYFLLYEGTGGTNNRLTNVLTESQLNPLWILKQIRLDVAHDVCHGKEKDVEKKLIKIGDAYKTLIGHSKPRFGKDYLNAQLALYMNLNTMLEDTLKNFE